MKRAFLPQASPPQFEQAAVDVPQACSSLGQRGNWPGVIFNSSSLTRHGRREVKRRVQILESFEALTQRGMSQAEAARELRISSTTLWRYRKRLEPLTMNCGRKSALEQFDPPARILRAVRQLQLGGKSNVDAWRAVA